MTGAAELRRLWAPVALAAWTFFVWTTRIGNIWNDAELDTSGKVGRTALALSFTVLAVVVVVALARRAVRPGWLRPAVLALAGWSTAVWVVRATSIVFADHDTAFKVVHVVLAVVSIGLSAFAARQVVRGPSAVPAGAPEPARR